MEGERNMRIKVESAKASGTIDEEELLERIIEDYTASKLPDMMRLRHGSITKDAFMEEVSAHAISQYQPTAETLKHGLQLFEQYVFGYSRLTPLIEDPEITDIRCIAYNNIRVKRKGKREAANVSFKSEDEYRTFISFVATKNQVNISNLNAVQRFCDNTSIGGVILRFTVIMPLLNTYDAPYLHIRKVLMDFPEMPELIKAGMMTEDLSKLLIRRFREGSTLICGSNSSGKTTIMNALKETLPENVAVMVCQQVDELTTKHHPDMMFTHSLPSAGESKVSYDLKDISIAGLTMDIDYFIVGETKGDEAAYLLNAAYSGQICATTLHAPGPKQALDKLIDYALCAPANHYTKPELARMLADCFQTVIYMSGYKVAQVCKIDGWDADSQEIHYTTLYEGKGR